MILKSISYQISPASFVLKMNDVGLLVPSMVLSTVWVLTVLTVAPWLAPVLMADVTGSNV